MFALLTESIQKDKKRSAIIIAVAVVLLLIFAISRFTSSSRDMKQLQTAGTNLLEAETMHAKAELDLDLPAQLRTQERPIVGVTVRVEGDVDNTGEVPQLDGTIFTEARGRGMVLFADGELRILPERVHFYLENLPALLNPRGNLINKWTRVDAPLLQTQNPDEVRAALAGILAGSTYVGKDTLPGTDNVTAKKYTRTFTPEQEEALSETFREAHSGNSGLHVITRLLRGFDVRTFEVWVVGDEIRRIYTEFDKEGDAEPRGILTLEFSDFGKEVTIEEVPEELTVDGAVFGRIFGRGEITELEQ